MSNKLDFYYKMILIRKFEERILELFSEGILFGTTHAYIGQEANAVGIIDHLNSDDIIFTNHRCHGHYLSFTGDAKGLLSELMGKETGVVDGRGGSQHIATTNFFSNGVQGGFLPIASGFAKAKKMQGHKGTVTAFIGDGTLGEGTVYETLNMASILESPLLIVVENNLYAQSTPIETNMRGSIVKRFEAFDIRTTEIDSFDVEEIHSVAGKIIGEMKTNLTPHALVIKTYRFCSHSKNDDGRDKNEIEKWRKKDPIKILEARIGTNDIKEINKKVDSLIAEAEEYSRNADPPVYEFHSGLDEELFNFT